MRFRFCIVILIIFSFFTIGAVSNIKLNNNFNQVEVKCRRLSEFSQSGVKLQYKTRNSLENEKKKIKTNLYTNNFKDEKCIGGNKFELSKDLQKVECDLWKDTNYTYIDIVVTNADKQYYISNFTHILNKIINSNCIDIQSYYYYKGKTNDNYLDKPSKSIDEITKNLNLNKIDLLELNNGYTAKSLDKNKESINIAVSKYNTGTYIIVGTPIIFITY